MYEGMCIYLYMYVCVCRCTSAPSDSERAPLRYSWVLLGYCEPAEVLLCPLRYCLGTVSTAEVLLGYCEPLRHRYDLNTFDTFTAALSTDHHTADVTSVQVRVCARAQSCMHAYDSLLCFSVCVLPV